jgi:hypothetical protein
VGRKNGRTKKKKEKSVSSGDEPPDADIHGLPYAENFGEWSDEEPEKAAIEEESDEVASDDSAGEQDKRHKPRPSVSSAAMTMPSHPQVPIAPPCKKPASPAAQLSADGQENNQAVTAFVYKTGMTLPGTRRLARLRHVPQLQEQVASKEQTADPSHGVKAKLDKPPRTVIKAGGNLPGKRLSRRGVPDPQPRRQRKKKKKKKKGTRATKKKRPPPPPQPPKHAAKSKEQTATDIRERMEAGVGSDEGFVGSD